MHFDPTSLSTFLPADRRQGGGGDMPTDAHALHPTLIRESDVRGIFGETLFVEDAEAIGRAFGTIIRACGGTRVCVGYDGRLSSPEIEQAVVQGLMLSGLCVIRIGCGPTPMLYFAVHHLDTHGGIMVTGSHNPAEYNGFKMMLGKASFFGRDIEHLADIAAKGQFANGQGSIITNEISEDYIQRLLEGCKDFGSLSIAWDPGNGATGDIIEEITQRLPGKHFVINGKIDGTFPAHHPDPTIPDNLVQLQEVVAREGCDLGVAFDGDGDRIGVIGCDGQIFWGDQLMVLFAEDVLKSHPGTTVICDVKASQSLFDKIKTLGGEPLMWKTGHSLIKSKMIETGAKLAGEMSGHIFFADKYFGFDDAAYAAVRLLDILSENQDALVNLRDRLPKSYSTPEIRLQCDEAMKRPVIKAVLDQLRWDHVDYMDVDGARVVCSFGWWLIRASNTQDVLVARGEATSQSGLNLLIQELALYLRRAGYKGDRSPLLPFTNARNAPSAGSSNEPGKEV